MDSRSDRQLEGTAAGRGATVVSGSPTSAMPTGRARGMVVLKLADDTLRKVGNDSLICLPVSGGTTGRFTVVVASGAAWFGSGGMVRVRVPCSVDSVTEVGTEWRPSLTMVSGSDVMVTGEARLYWSQLSLAVAVPNPGCQKVVRSPSSVAEARLLSDPGRRPLEKASSWPAVPAGRPSIRSI